MRVSLSKRIAAVVAAIAVTAAAHVSAAEPAIPADSLPPLEGNWADQLIKSGFHINDPRIDYPRFLRFCVKVYNWGDRTFNSFDPAYVTGTGKNWKILGKSYNWNQSYALLFSKDKRIQIASDITSDIGLSLHFMALSIGYTVNTNELLAHPDSRRHTFEFSFTSGRFTASLLNITTHGGATITRFGDYHHNHHFNKIWQTSTMADIYYFFNPHRYSHAAAYCFSKYQLRSAGSWLLGVNAAKQNIAFDFKGLPDEMQEQLPSFLSRYYRFHNYDICLAGGYAYNWVIRPRRWLFNVTAIPMIGYKHQFADSGAPRKDALSSNFKCTFALVYNHRAFFAGLSGYFDGRLYYTRGMAFFNSQESLTLQVGARF